MRTPERSDRRATPRCEPRDNARNEMSKMRRGKERSGHAAYVQCRRYIAAYTLVFHRNDFKSYNASRNMGIDLDEFYDSPDVDATILIVGPPGSGKGTQSPRLCAERPGLVYLESGVLVRDWVKQGSDLAKAYAPRLARGELLDDAQMFDVYRENRARMIENGVYTPNVSVLLADGYPRTVGQATANTMLNVYGIIELYVEDPEVLVRRIQRDPKRAHRTDNDRDTILHRIKVYEEKTLPMVEFYASRGVPVAGVDAEYDIDAVTSMVSDACKSFIY